MIALVLGWTCYGLLCVVLLRATYHVVGPPPDWMVRWYHWKWRGTLKEFFTVRYELDDGGLWQIVEETATGNRYRVQVRDAKGNYRW